MIGSWILTVFLVMIFTEHSLGASISGDEESGLMATGQDQALINNSETSKILHKRGGFSPGRFGSNINKPRPQNPQLARPPEIELFQAENMQSETVQMGSCENIKVSLEQLFNFLFPEQGPSIFPLLSCYGPNNDPLAAYMSKIMVNEHVPVVGPHKLKCILKETKLVPAFTILRTFCKFSLGGDYDPRVPPPQTIHRLDPSIADSVLNLVRLK